MQWYLSIHKLLELLRHQLTCQWFLIFHYFKTAWLVFNSLNPILTGLLFIHQWSVSFPLFYWECFHFFPLLFIVTQVLILLHLLEPRLPRSFLILESWFTVEGVIPLLLTKSRQYALLSGSSLHSRFLLLIFPHNERTVSEFQLLFQIIGSLTLRREKRPHSLCSKLSLLGETIPWWNLANLFAQFL